MVCSILHVRFKNIWYIDELADKIGKSENYSKARKDRQRLVWQKVCMYKATESQDENDIVTLLPPSLIALALGIESKRRE